MQANTCVDKCIDGYYQLGNRCLPCDSTCKQCTQKVGHCVLCVNDLRLFKNTCISVNPSRHYFDINDKMFKNCLPNCMNCTTGHSCDKCSYGFFQYLGKCISSCPAIYLEDIITRKCLLKQKMVGNIEYFTFKPPETYFTFFGTAVLILIALRIVKTYSQITFYFASSIGFLSIINIAFTIYFTLEVYYFGVVNVFLPLMAILLTSALINCAFAFTFIFYSFNDSDFRYWLTNSNKNTILFLVHFIPSSIFDFKIFRLAFSRLMNLTFFSSIKFRNYEKVQRPNKILASLDIIFINISILVYSVILLIKLPIITSIWYVLIESILFNSLFLALKILDLIFYNNLDEDFYNQPISNVEVKPYRYKPDQYSQRSDIFIENNPYKSIIDFWSQKLIKYKDNGQLKEENMYINSLPCFESIILKKLVEGDLEFNYLRSYEREPTYSKEFGEWREEMLKISEFDLLEGQVSNKMSRASIKETKFVNKIDESKVIINYSDDKNANNKTDFIEENTQNKAEIKLKNKNYISSEEEDDDCNSPSIKQSKQENIPNNLPEKENPIAIKSIKKKLDFSTALNPSNKEFDLVRSNNQSKKAKQQLPTQILNPRIDDTSEDEDCNVSPSVKNTQINQKENILIKSIKRLFNSNKSNKNKSAKKSSGSGKKYYYQLEKCDKEIVNFDEIKLKKKAKINDNRIFQKKASENSKQFNKILSPIEGDTKNFILEINESILSQSFDRSSLNFADRHSDFFDKKNSEKEKSFKID